MSINLDSDALYETAPCGLVTTSANGLIERANRTFCHWIGFEPKELIGRKRLQDLFTVGCRIFHQTHWMPLLQMQGSVAEVQLEFVHRDKQVLYVLVNAVRHVTDGAAIQDDLALFIAADRRKYERELLLARRRAEELLVSERAAQDALNEALREQEREAQERALLAEQLIGIVSHDLRTPLQAVLLGARTLEATQAAPAQGRTVGRIIAASQRASRLISDLLDFTQARIGGGLRVHRAPIDLHDVVAESVEELRLASPGRLIEHQRHGEGTCSADPDRLAQLVTNLASNALAYGAPERPITIVTSEGEGAPSLAVHNFGEPIPASLVPNLFEPFRRGEQQVRRGSRSVGMGLYIVQQIAKAHGGGVAVHSTREAGTTFTVTLPA